MATQFKKDVVSEGNKKDYPQKGDEVAMNYTGWLYDDSKPNKRGSQCVPTIDRRLWAGGLIHNQVRQLRRSRRFQNKDWCWSRHSRYDQFGRSLDTQIERRRMGSRRTDHVAW